LRRAPRSSQSSAIWLRPSMENPRRRLNATASKIAGFFVSGTQRSVSKARVLVPQRSPTPRESPADTGTPIVTRFSAYSNSRPSASHSDAPRSRRPPVSRCVPLAEDPAADECSSAATPRRCRHPAGPTAGSSDPHRVDALLESEPSPRSEVRRCARSADRSEDRDRRTCGLPRVVRCPRHRGRRANRGS